jgi:hypothetical protein
VARLLGSLRASELAVLAEPLAVDVLGLYQCGHPSGACTDHPGPVESERDLLGHSRFVHPDGALAASNELDEE